MKNKIVFSFFLFCILIFINSICFASEITISTEDELKENTNIIVKVSINTQELDEKIYFLQGQLDYDQNIFEKVTAEDITLLNNWHGLVFNSENGKFVIEGNEKNENDIQEIMNINLKSKKNINIKTTTIQIKDVKEIGESEVENELENSILNIVEKKQEANLANTILPFTGSNSFIFYAIIILSIITLTSIILIIKKNNSSH